MDSIIAAHFPPGGTIIRAMAARLEVGGTIKPHTDAQECGRIASTFRRRAIRMCASLSMADLARCRPDAPTRSTIRRCTA
jgi:hypothetical protein